MKASDRFPLKPTQEADEMNDHADKANRFLELHRQEHTLLLANAWDAGSAKLLASLGFQALPLLLPQASGRPSQPLFTPGTDESRQHRPTIGRRLLTRRNAKVSAFLRVSARNRPSAGAGRGHRDARSRWKGVAGAKAPSHATARRCW
jgi:hypothetical protein